MMKKKTKVFWLTAAAFVFLAGAAVPPAMAYFTTYVEAEGGYPITLGNETTIEEKVENIINTKEYLSRLTIGSYNEYPILNKAKSSYFNITKFLNR